MCARKKLCWNMPDAVSHHICVRYLLRCKSYRVIDRHLQLLTSSRFQGAGSDLPHSSTDS